GPYGFAGPSVQDGPSARLIRAVVGVAFVVLLAGLWRSGRLGRRGRGCRSRLFDQVLRLLVEARVHVVAHLEDGLAPGAHDVGLAVVLGAEDAADRLPLLVGERDAEVGAWKPSTGLSRNWLGGLARVRKVQSPRAYTVGWSPRLA